MKTADSGAQGRGSGIVAAGVFAIAAGLGEIIVGITGNSSASCQNLWNPRL